MNAWKLRMTYSPPDIPLELREQVIPQSLQDLTWEMSVTTSEYPSSRREWDPLHTATPDPTVHEKIAILRGDRTVNLLRSHSATR